ncbi:MAG: FkbM family methyltransferase [Candidatus Liptonbacteria bacterium]|nr:FkbM family methyltransferase [Candidatus Liptonbacteria bacterium]
MVNFSRLPQKSFLGGITRFFLNFIPDTWVLRILQGPLRGKKWVKGSGVNGYWLGSYEPKNQKLFQGLIKRGDTVFDIGAHVGFYSLLFSQLVGPGGKVFAFEPLSRNVQLLKKHTGLNNISNVVVVECAVAETEGEQFFSESAGNSLGMITNVPQLTKVKTVSLDEFVKNGKIVPNFLKIDVEGAELLVLSGAKELLFKHHPVIFLAIHNNEMRGGCVALFRRFGYRPSILFEDPLNGIYELLCE